MPRCERPRLRSVSMFGAPPEMMSEIPGDETEIPGKEVEAAAAEDGDAAAAAAASGRLCPKMTLTPPPRRRRKSEYSVGSLGAIEMMLYSVVEKVFGWVAKNVQGDPLIGAAMKFKF